MMKKSQFALVLFLWCGVFSVSAQSYGKKAKKQFELRALELAAYNYNLALEQEPDNPDYLVGLAMCFAYMNNNLEAVSYFEKAEQEGELTDKDLLVYGNCFKQMADYDNARIQYEKLSQSSPILGNHYLLSCDYAEKLLREKMQYELYTFGGNTALSDFGVVKYNDSWVFTSFRNDIASTEKKNQVPGSRLYVTGKIAAKNNAVGSLRNPMRDSYRMGPITYSEDLKLCAFTRNKFKEGYKPVFADDMDHSIVLAEVEVDGDFINESSFQHNELGSSTAFPCYAFNGSALYFSSNRQGGYGGFDLYVSYRKDGEWTVPENLGPAINSPGNEITPYFDDHNLFYASDYIHGLGGYDLFKSEVYNGQWTFPSNLGNGVNSPDDDLFPYVDAETNKIYFSSNRLGAKGGLDIYVAFKNEDQYLANLAEPQVPLADNVSFNAENFDMAIPRSVSNNETVAVYEELPPFEEEVIITETIAEDNSDVEIANEDFIEDDKEEAVPKAFVLPKSSSNKPYAPSPSNWEGATMVSLNENLLTGTKVYFIQLAALSRSSAKAMKFKGLSKFGNIYTVNQSNLTKVRLGYYLDEREAKKVLTDIKRRGFNDAFITSTALNTSEMELLLSNSNMSTDTYMVPSKFKGKSSYKVRLASYEDPIWFDIKKVKDIGKIEQWTKGGWTIFILSGYVSKQEAERARIKAVNKGFTDAEIVLDNNGILERVKKN